VYNNQNQNQFMKAQNYNAKVNMENSSELAQSQGQISRLLLAKASSGQFEFASMSPARPQSQSANSSLQSQLEVDRSAGQISQILSSQSK
jgi:hypothetical protein